jgi:hypothetical protein
MRRFLCPCLFLLFAILLGSRSVPTLAQPKPVVPTMPPQFPTITSPVWLGTTPGKPDEHTITGTNLAEVTQILTPASIRATRISSSEKGDSAFVKFEAAPNTTVGLYPFRIVTKHGVSNFRPVCVDDLPFVEKKAGNNKKATPMAVPVPCVVAGSIAPESSDFYSLKVVAGQRLTFEALARRIGSQLDPVLILHDAKNGREMPTLYADDTLGLQSDARVTHTFPTAMEVIVEIRDTTYRGGADFTYRLRIGDFPGCTTAYPLAVEKGQESEIGFTGTALEGVQPVKVKGEGTAVLVAPKRAQGASGWSVPVLVSDHPETLEKEPNNTTAQANKLPVPGGVSAKFAEKGDVDHYAITAKKGQKLEIVARTYEVNSATEVLIRVLDDKGKELAKSDPAKAAARVDYTPAADGELFVVTEHLNYAYGPSEVYHLTVRPAVPDFDVLLGNDRVDVSANGIATLAVVGFTKQNGFNAAVELSAEGDAVTGTLSLPAAANPLPATPLVMNLQLKKEAKPGVHPFRVKAIAKIDGKEVVRYASLSSVLRDGLAGLPNVPREWPSQLYAIAAEKPLMVVSVTWEKPEVTKGTPLKGKVSARRADGFAEEIQLTAQNLPANVTAKLKPIVKGASEAEIELNPAANAAPGEAKFYFRSTAKNAGKDFAYNSDFTSVKIVEPKKDEKKKDEPKKDEKKKP